MKIFQTNIRRTALLLLCGRQKMGHLQSHQGGITFYLFQQSVLEHMQFRSQDDLQYLKVARTLTKQPAHANPLR